MGRSGLSEVEERIATAAVSADRIDPVTLVVVAKYASDQELEAVIAEGADHIGESRADSLIARAGRFQNVSWHFVGRLQGNKVRKVRPTANLLHSMDRESLADYWSRGETKAPPVLVQVNLAGEPQKAGVAGEGVLPLLEKCAELAIDVCGLMAVPPRGETPEDGRRWFAALRQLRDRVSLDYPRVKELSMGMTDDFPVAVSEGATILRVGRAIFDPFRNEG